LPPIKNNLERILLFLLSTYYFDRKFMSSRTAFYFMSPPPPINQWVTLFSPKPNDPHSGRSTPSSVGGVSSGRASTLTVDSSGAISFDTQFNSTICPIPMQGPFAILDPDTLTSKKPSGREKGAATYSSVEHVALLSIMSQVPDSFNCSESSPQWEEVYKRKNTE
jgi:hypothetical protein